MRNRCDMKIKLLCITLFIFGISQAQIELVPNPCDINTGTITLKYGESGDYSIFDPMSDPNLYLYTGLQTDADPMTWDYHDDFTNVATMILLIRISQKQILCIEKQRLCSSGCCRTCLFSN